MGHVPQLGYRVTEMPLFVIKNVLIGSCTAARRIEDIVNANKHMSVEKCGR